MFNTMFLDHFEQFKLISQGLVLLQESLYWLLLKMVSSSSSGREYVSAEQSPEHHDASNSSGSGYQSVQEELHNNIAPRNKSIEKGRENIFQWQNSATPTRPRNSFVSLRRAIDLTVPLSSNIKLSNHQVLSATASDFVPRTRRNMPTISEEGRSFASRSRTSSTTPPRPRRAIYDNRVSGIPTHWIPIYGAGHGIFYDPVSKLFYGDGAPRPTLERSDGTMQPMDNKKPIPPFGFQSEDILHIQPQSMIESLVKEVENDHHVLRRYYCRCEDAWLERPHECPIGWEGEEELVDQTSPIALWPETEIPSRSTTHDLVIGDLSYLTPRQLYAYEYGMPMLMPSVTGMGKRR